MLRILRWALAGCGLWVWAMAGCGGSAPPASSPQPTAPTAANLNGNWLLAGSLPQGPLRFASAPSSVSVTFSVVGDQLVGSGYLSVFCAGATPGNGSGVGGSFVVTGTVKPDSTFSVQTPSSPAGLLGVSVAISGSVPVAPGQAWSGQYTLDASQSSTTCHPVASGSFAASSLGTVTGTYAGTGTLGLGTSAPPVSVSVSLQQGSASLIAGVTPAQQSSVLSGTISVTGHPCFHSGSVLPPASVPVWAPGNVAGDEMFASFRMDDGSTLVLVGYIADPLASQLRVQSAVVLTGPCSTSSVASMQLSSLIRQD